MRVSDQRRKRRGFNVKLFRWYHRRALQSMGNTYIPIHTQQFVDLVNRLELGHFILSWEITMRWAPFLKSFIGQCFSIFFFLPFLLHSFALLWYICSLLRWPSVTTAARRYIGVRYRLFPLLYTLLFGCSHLNGPPPSQVPENSHNRNWIFHNSFLWHSIS